MYGHPFPFRRQPSPPPHFANASNPNKLFLQPSLPQYPLNVPNSTTAFFHQPPQSFPFPNTAWPFPQNQPLNLKLAIDHAECVAAAAFSVVLAAGGSVSAWEVSQTTMSMLQVDSRNSFGIKMQQVPFLHCILITEGKVNAFVHCFVGVRRITSLYDLEVAICKNEGVDNIEASFGYSFFLPSP